MTTATFVMPLLGRKKDIVKTTGVANSALLGAVVPADHIGILIDEATIDLTKIHSGLLVPAMEELRDTLIAKSAIYTNLNPEQSFYTGNLNKTPKLNSTAGTANPAAATITQILQTAGTNVALVMTTNDETDPTADPPPTNRDTGIGYVAAQYLADYIRESLK